MNKCKSYLYLHLPTCMHTQANKICSSTTNAVVQLPSHVQLFDPSCTAAHQASLSFIMSQSLLKVMSIKSVMHPTISSSVTTFSSCLQSFPTSGSFRKSWLFTSGDQSIRASASVLPMNIQG